MGKRKISAKYIIGIDEAGRGPLAGPLTIAAVMCSQNIARSNFFKNIKDSKRSTARQRKEWYLKMQEHPRIFCFSTSIGPELIDRYGLTKATYVAIRRLLYRMGKPNCKILLDGGLKAPGEYLQETHKGGDQTIPVITAASVIAKYTRDSKMERLSKLYPQYEFHRHKAYGTKLHRKLIKKHGLSDIHRKSFKVKLV